MTKRIFYLLLTFLLLFDIGATYWHVFNWQLIARPGIILLLIFYYFQQIEIVKTGDYLIISAYLATLLAEIFYIPSGFENFALVIIFLVLKVGIIIFVIAREFRFYVFNKPLLIILTIVLIIISQVIAINFSTSSQYLIFECIFTAGIAIIFAMALMRRVNKKSYEQVVIGVMTSAFAIILMSNNLVNFQILVEILARIAHCMGLLFLTFGILNSEAMRS